MLIDFNLKEKFKELKCSGKKLPKEYFDLGVAFWLLNPDEKEYAPEYLSRKYLRQELGEGKVLLEKLYNYAEKKLKEYKLEKLFYEVEMPLIDILADMELRGIKLNVQSLKLLDKKLEKDLAVLAKNIYKAAGEIFNINSSKQLGQILFKKLNIDVKGIKKTRSGAISTDIDALLTIRERHPITQYILEYRALFKLQSTYVRPLQDLADKDSKVHTTYIQTGTVTGRLSSQNPNLQNIPASTEVSAGKPAEGDLVKEVRQAFIPEKGFALASFDYSQIELRALASLSGDAKMIEAFNNDLDIHKITAANVFNMPIEKVTPGMRRLAKTLNFGVVYGMGAVAFSKASGLSVVEARRFIAEYFSDFKKIKEWQEQVKNQARISGYVTNLNGRRRLLLQAVSMFRNEAAAAERAAINMPVQGLAADIIKIAMIKLTENLKKKGWYGDKVWMLLTIHDELLFEIDEHIIKEAIEFISKIMGKAYELEVPIKVNVKVGKNWGELE